MVVELEAVVSAVGGFDGGDGAPPVAQVVGKRHGILSHLPGTMVGAGRVENQQLGVGGMGRTEGKPGLAIGVNAAVGHFPGVENVGSGDRGAKGSGHELLPLVEGQILKNGRFQGRASNAIQGVVGGEATGGWGEFAAVAGEGSAQPLLF